MVHDEDFLVDNSTDFDSEVLGDRVELGVTAELSINSVVGLTKLHTMRLQGKINDQEVTVLIDCSATHNFISHDLVNQLHLPISPTAGYGVSMGNGLTVQGKSICKGVGLSLQNLEVVADFLPIDLGGTDVVPGMQWLESLGTMQVNWQLLRMSFQLGGVTVTLQGDPSLGKSRVSLKAMIRTIWHEGNALLLEFNHVASSVSVMPCPVPNSISRLLHQFRELFETPQGLPPPRSRDHSIVLREGATPISVRPYRYPQIQKNEIERLVGEMLADGLIQPSSSPFSSPILLVKKEGSWRFCVDYRALNRETVPDKFPIPMIEELLDELHGACWFSKLDLRSSYHQIRVTPQDVPKTAFRTNEGHYEFLVMHFGLTNAPATFQALMNEIFKPLLRKSVLVLFDDILVYSPTLEDHENHLAQVLQLLHKHSLFVNKKKCLFAQPSMEYLGHVVSGNGVSADLSKVSAIQAWPVPQSIRELRGFLGLTGYYRKFVAGYGGLARPLTEQLKKDRFCWSPMAQEAFERLKTAMSSLPVLALPDFSQPFVVETDASRHGLGVVLMQNQRPIAFFSQQLSHPHHLKSVYERELMAIVLAIQKWRPYLLGQKFIIRTDQRSLKYLLEHRLVSPNH